MSLAALCACFPVVLAVHNADELRQYDTFVRIQYARLPRRFVVKPAVQLAAILLTCAGVALGLATWMRRTPFLLDASIVAALALMLNACSHILTSIRLRSLTPGTLSALVIVLPYGIAVVCAARLSWKALLRFTAIGILAMPLVAVLFLCLGYGLTRLFVHREG